MTTQEERPRIGLEATIEKIVPHEWTLAHFNPQLPTVLSTPAMIGMMEIAAAQAVQAELPAGAITVGTRIEVDHLKAVPEGTPVRATARLVEHKGRFMIFEVQASAGEHVVGRGASIERSSNRQNFRRKLTRENPDRNLAAKDQLLGNVRRSTSVCFGTLRFEDEGCHIIVQSFQRGRACINHVPGFVKLKFDVLLQFRWNRQVLHFVNSFVKRRGEIEVAGVQQYFEVGVIFHRHREVGHHVRRHR